MENIKTSKQIINDYNFLSLRLKDVEEECQKKINFHKAELDSFKNYQILEDLGLEVGDKVVLKLLEYRDDRVHCFQVEKETICFIDKIFVINDSEIGKSFLAPSLKFKDKKGNLKKTVVNYSRFLSWELYKDNELIMEYKSEQIIIDGTYTEEEINKIRERYKTEQTF